MFSIKIVRINLISPDNFDPNDRNQQSKNIEFDGVICEIFERLNSGKPLTDNDKYWNRKETPANG